jgi:hypothetical protein
MEAKCFSETSVDFQRVTRHYITEDRTLHNHRCENPKSQTGSHFFSALTFLLLRWVYSTKLAVYSKRKYQAPIKSYCVMWFRNLGIYHPQSQAGYSAVTVRNESAVWSWNVRSIWNGRDWIGQLNLSNKMSAIGSPELELATLVDSEKHLHPHPQWASRPTGDEIWACR